MSERGFGGLPIGVGDVLVKKYRIEKLIGEGGTGIVVAARHVQLEQRVAIKFLRQALASEEIRQRFEREVRAIGKIQSEHVVLVLDASTLPDGEPFMVMEYLEGRDLARVLKEDGPLSLEDAVDCMLQVCEALGEAHANGIIHRDLKPANLFLTRRDDDAPHVKVVDFGISKILDQKLLQEAGAGPREMTMAFTVLGSPRYMAPEQLRNSRDVDGRADLWSVGAVLFQLVTGKHAFDAENNTQASMRVLTSEPEDLCKLAPHVPPEIGAIVKRCLTKDVAGRFRSAAELAQALMPFASERTRDSIERMKKAREAPSLQIALLVSSTSEAPPPVHSSSRPPGYAPAPPPYGSVHPAPNREPAREAMRQVSTAPHAFAPPHPSSGFLPDPTASHPALPAYPPTGPAPGKSRALPFVVAACGALAVLLCIGVFAMAKLRSQSFGLMKPLAREPAKAGAPAATLTPLDAGRAPP